MRILFIFSFYSALRESYFKEKWQPTGMPAVVNLFERLQQKKEYFDCFFISNEHRKNYPLTVKLSNFSGSFHLINQPYISKVFKKVKIIRDIIKIIEYLNLLLRVLFLKNNYDVYYVDRSNVVVGALLSFFLKKKVILRLHGVTELNIHFRSIKYKLLNPLIYFSYKAPFSYILCSEDGTPGEQFLNSFTNNNVKKEVLLNGVNYEPDLDFNIKKIYKVPDNKTLLLFVSRIERDKGIGKFLDVVSELNNFTDKYYTVIVGDGSSLEYYKTKYEEHSNIVFTGAVHYSKIASFYYYSDIFISLNELGNLCNTMLEALSAGNCIITYNMDAISGKDYSTTKYLENIALFINRDNAESDLLKVLLELEKNEEQLRMARLNSSAFSDNFLTSWDQRIDYELNIIDRLAAGI